MKITKISVRNFMGIEARDIAVPPGGFIARGDNGFGKTSILMAVRSALAAQQISPAAIRNGSDRAEILIDIDDVSVKRVTTLKGSTLTVERAGMRATGPQAFITKLVGSSAIDPLDIMLLKPKERRAAICAATWMTVTLEQLRKYAPDLDDKFDVTGHGLDVVERARKFYYDERTGANKDAAETKATAERLTKEAQALSAAVTPGPVVPGDEAAKAVTDAERAIAALEARKREALDATERTATQRARIAELRTTANAEQPVPVDVASFRVEVANAKAVVLGLEENLRVARHALTEAQAQLDGAIETQTAAERAKARAVDAAAQADSLEAALAAATVTAPSEAEVTTAAANLAAAKALLDRASAQATAMAAVQAAEAAKKEHAAFEAEAAELDQIVKRLANEAPVELLAAAEGIPGLTLDGDDVLLDGVRLNDRSGAEQMRFAVDVARRANAQSKIIVCDGLERLAPAKQASFVAMATAGGYQLLATAVQDGAIEIQAIESDDEAKAAE